VASIASRGLSLTQINPASGLDGSA
jgi:hypothetical protein